MNVDEMVKEFGDCVVSQSEAIMRGDPTTGNKFAKRYIAAINGLRAIGDPGRDALATVLDDENEDARVMAAAYLLRHCEAKARPVLERAAAGKGLAALAADMTLKNWREGTWNMDPL